MLKRVLVLASLLLAEPAVDIAQGAQVSALDLVSDGPVEVFGSHGDGYQSIGQIPTVSGARTALFVADADRLHVAVRARFREPAAIWVFRPTP